MNSFYEHLQNLLKQNNEFVDDDGNILRNKVIESANKFDAELLKLLLSDEKARAEFFVDVNGVKVFKQNEFVQFINNREFLPDSYTSFKNKIGLVDEHGNFISNSSNVELVFPYKDCVLEGGQTKDDQKRAEIFYNETLARDEVNTLLAQKVFTNAKKFSADGVDPCDTISPTDNLIIKGNNLIALACLRKKFQNKIKCIYIDVPYNTGNDSFGYNDRFNHSTWLTFMKNRLELAKNLLRNDGSIWISIDDDEQAYLKILCDEIFGRDNFITSVCIKMSHLSGVKMSHINKGIPKLKEFLIIFCKNKDNFFMNPVYEVANWNDVFERYTSFVIKDEHDPEDFSKWQVLPLRQVAISRGIDVTNKKSYEKFCIENANCIFRTARNNSAQFQNLPCDNEFRKILTASGLKKLSYKGEEVLFCSESMKTIDGKLIPVKPIGDIWTDIGINNLHNEGGVSLKNAKKPERLIQRILTLATNEGDIVLDNFVGSGTTAAVAHKMKRQYIGVEQMDYIETVTVERLKRVIGGEQGGISKAVDWQGGGSFIYCELAKLNQNFVDEIAAAKDFETIQALYKKIAHSYFISYKVKPKDMDAAIDYFAALSMDDQKRLLMELLDKNMLYVNYSDIDDADFAVCDADKKFTRSFYNEGFEK